MIASLNKTSSRREFLKTSGRMATASALAGVVLPAVHAAGNDTIQLALIGCGGRGKGAAANALSTKSGPIKLVAMADVFEKKLQRSYESLIKDFTTQVDVPQDRKFIGFEGYRQALAWLQLARALA